MINPDHIHPLLIHFPVALVLAGFFLELCYLFCRKEICFTKAGFYLLILGTLGAIAAFASGHLLTTEPSGGAIEEIYEQHETGGLITLILLGLTLLLRIYLLLRKKEIPVLKWVAFLLYLSAAIAVSITGFLGGTMVYDYMMPL